MDNQFDANRYDWGKQPDPQPREPLAAYFYENVGEVQSFLPWTYEEANKDNQTEVDMWVGTKLISIAFSFGVELMKERWNWIEYTKSRAVISEEAAKHIIIVYAAVAAVREWENKICGRLGERSAGKTPWEFMTRGQEKTFSLGAEVGGSAMEVAFDFCATLEGCIDAAMEEAVGYIDGESYKRYPSENEGSFLPEDKSLLTEEVIDDFFDYLMMHMFGFEDFLIPYPKDWKFWEFVRDTNIIKRHMDWETVALTQESPHSLRAALGSPVTPERAESPALATGGLAAYASAAAKDGIVENKPKGRSAITFSMKQIAQCCGAQLPEKEYVQKALDPFGVRFDEAFIKKNRENYYAIYPAIPNDTRKRLMKIEKDERELIAKRRNSQTTDPRLTDNSQNGDDS